MKWAGGWVRGSSVGLALLPVVPAACLASPVSWIECFCASLPMAEPLQRTVFE